MWSNERKEAHLLQLKQAYADAIQRVKDKEGVAVDRYEKKIITAGCFHPAHCLYEDRERGDNGYGRWHTRISLTCRLCGKALETRYTHP